MSAADPSQSVRRWVGRPISSAVIRAVAFLVPVAAALAVAITVGRLLPSPATEGALALWWGGFLASSLTTLILFDRLARRLLPLSVLMKMTLLFPDRAPSRLQVARRAGRVRDLKRRVAEAREKGIDDEPTKAALGVLSLVGALTAHDRLTRGHSERVRAFIDLLAEEVPIIADDRERLRWAGLLHDIGKLSVSATILNKPGRPDPQEWEEIRKHPLEGLRIAKPLLPFMGAWAGTIEHHHEKFDGSGYPHGISSSDISLGGRIGAVADCFEVMTAARPYKHPMSPEAAREELTRCAGSHFDPELVRAFLNISVGRLWRAIGLASWLAQFPVFRQLSYHGFFDRFGRLTAITLLAVLGLFTFAGVGAVGMPTSVAAPSSSESSPAPLVRDPSGARVSVTGNLATATWDAEPTAAAYSTTWTRNPRDLPDETADLPGEATQTVSPPLDPGSWWFHLRTRGASGEWTSTIHVPFTIEENPVFARVEGPFEVALTGVSSEGDIRATDHSLLWTFVPTCPAGPCDLQRTEGALTPPNDSFTYDGSRYLGVIEVPLGRCGIEKVTIQFQATAAMFVDAVWRATEISGTKTVEMPPGPRGCASGRATWSFMGART